MKNRISIVILSLLFTGATHAQIPIVGTIIAKVIKAIDLKVQKLQNQTIWLQQAQQVAEHELSKMKLSEITQWQQKQEALYAGYFKELRQVKLSITGMSQVKRMIGLQQQVALEYGRFAKDANLKPEYDALLSGSIEILSTLQLVMGSGSSMKDSDRILMIESLKDAMSQCLKNIKTLNDQNLRLTATRARMQADIQFVKRLNGLQ